MALTGIRGTGAFANDQLGKNGEFGGVILETLKPLEQDACCCCAHFAERLANGGQAGSMVVGELDVVKTDDGDVLGDTEIGVAKSADGSNGSHVVEGNDSGERTTALEEGLDDGIAEFGRRDVAFELDSKFRQDGNIEFLSLIHI